MRWTPLRRHERLDEHRQPNDASKARAHKSHNRLKMIGRFPNDPADGQNAIDSQERRGSGGGNRCGRSGEGRGARDLRSCGSKRQKNGGRQATVSLRKLLFVFANVNTLYHGSRVLSTPFLASFLGAITDQYGRRSAATSGSANSRGPTTSRKYVYLSLIFVLKL
jgi:hypothetical protein